MKKSRQREPEVLAMPREALPSDTDRISQDVSDSDVTRRAYERFLERGSEHGHDLDDWLEAQRELRQSAAAKPPCREAIRGHRLRRAAGGSR